MPYPVDSAEEHIENIRQIWLGTPREAASVTSNALNDIIHSIFADPERIGYELLQNADDAATEDGLSVDIEFFLLEKYLVIRHNGAHFSSHNVKALCGYGGIENEDSDDNKEEKQYDIQKIGYKGIGFKSVFNISDRVWVLSNKFTFRYDKDCWNGRPMPWQIVPVFTPWSELPTSLSKIVDENKVNFVLEIRDGLNSNDIRNKLASLFKNENIILFLRHTRSLEMLYEDRDHSIKTYRKLLRTADGPVFTLKKFEKGDLKETTRWHISTFPAPVSSENRGSLTHLDKRQCPEKLRQAEQIEISFAAKLWEDNSIIPLDRPLIFSYLPTGKRYEFPFLVNSNFLMNEARTELLNEQWNEFLFEQIGYFQFHWFRQMADSEDFRYEFANLLKKFSTEKEQRHKKLNAGVKRAQNEIAFVPVMKSFELKKAPETIVDKTGFSDGFGEAQFVRDSFEPTVKYEIADPRIKRIEKLLSVGAEKFDPQKLREAIRKGKHFTSINDSQRLLLFFYSKISGIEDSQERGDWMRVLQETPFLLDQDGALREPGALYFPSGLSELPFDLPMAFLDNEIFGKNIAQNSSLTSWLERLGVAFPKPIEIIRRGIFPMIEQETINLLNAIVIGRYIFENSESLSSDDFQKLSQLSLLTSKGSLRKACFCYLPDSFKPKLPLENLLDEDIFISETYKRKEEEPSVWNRFFSKLMARQEMVLELHERFFTVNHEFKNHYREYWDFLQDYLPTFNRNAAHRLSSLLLPRYIQHADRFDFSMAYWKILLDEKWKELLQKSNKAKFVHQGGTVPIPSYFQFLVQTKPYFPASDNNSYPTLLVYSSALADLVANWSPVSAIDLSPEQEKHLGIKSALSLDDCFSILNDISKNTESLGKERISKLYQFMLSQRFQHEEIEACVQHGEALKLLAVNNTFQPAKQLLFLNVPRFAEKSDSPHFVFLDLPDEKAIEFCNLMGLVIIELQDMELAFVPYEDKIAEDVFPSDWQSKLPFIATISANKKGRDYQQELNRLEILSNEISFKPAKSLKLTLDKEGVRIYQKDVHAWQDETNIHYLNAWQDVRTLFDLQEVLASSFDLEGCERELGLLLSIKTEQIASWLQEQGYEPPSDIIELPQPIKNGKEESSITSGKSAVKVPVEIADIPPPIIIKPEYQYRKGSYTSIEKNVAGEIGRWGEELVKNKGIIEEYYQVQNTAITLEWMNEHEESGSPFDFKVTLDSGDVHFWEVKSTPSAIKTEYPISSNEFRFALQNEERYFIIRIFSARTQAPDCNIIENPVQLIREGIISVVDLKMVLENKIDNDPYSRFL